MKPTSFLEAAKTAKDPQHSGFVGRGSFAVCAAQDDTETPADPLLDSQFGALVRVLVCTLLAALLFAPPIAAAGATWTSLGPFGGRITALVIDPRQPSTLYAGTHGGVFKSSDGAGTWVLSSRHPITSIEFLTLDPSDSQTIYAGSTPDVFRSTDGGKSWKVLEVLPGHIINQPGSVTVDPRDSRKLYAGTEQGFFRSVDRGRSWKRAVKGPPSGIYRIAVHPRSATIYAATQNLIFRSADGGDSWAMASEGLESDSINILLVAGNAGVFAGTETGLFRTDAGSPAWKRIADLTQVRDVVAHQSVLYLATIHAVHKSLDGGQSWTRVAELRDSEIHHMVLDSIHPETLYLGTEQGIMKSTDGGASWLPANGGLNAHWVWSVVVDPANSAVILAGGPQLWKSADRGKSWIAISERKLQRMLFDPKSSQVLYGATSSAVVKSVDGGGQWTELLSLGTTHALAIDPSDGNTMYTAVFRNGIFKTSDGGENWKTVNTGLEKGRIISIVINPLRPKIVYAGSWEHGLFITENGGESWIAIGTLPNRSVRDIVAHPSNPSVLYVATSSGVFRSDDAGKSWDLTLKLEETEAPESVAFLEIDREHPANLFAAVQHYSSVSVLRSADGGRTWTTLPEFNARSVSDLALAPDRSALYAATWHTGVYRLSLPAGQ